MACATLKRSLDWEPVLSSRPAKRRRCTPFCGSGSHHAYRDRAGSSSSSSYSSSPPPSPPKPVSLFPDVVSKKLTPEYMAASIKAEIKRLQKRKQLQYHHHLDTSDSSSGGEQADSPMPAIERPLFTFKQVGLICERLIRDRESEIREEYDNVLTAKLAEQYDAFVRFTYDQIHKNYQAAPSYLS